MQLGELGEPGWYWLPSGKLSHNYGKSPFFNGKTHYKWSFSIAMLNYQRVWLAGWWFGTWILFSTIVGMMIQSELSYFSGGLKPPTRLWLVLLLINNAWWRNIDESWWIRIRKIGYWWHDRRNMNKAKMHVRVQVEPQSLFRRGATEVFKSPWEESTSAFRRSPPNDTIPNQWVCLKIWYLIHFHGSNMFKPSFSYYLMGIIWG